MMARAPTLADVASRAGVSYATADRVVNARGRVAEKSMIPVLKAVAELGYVRNVAAANLARRRIYTFCFVIPEGTNAFMDAFCNILSETRTRLLVDHVALQIRRVAAFDPDALSQCLRDLAGQEIDGVALVGTEAVSVHEAIADLRARGIAVLTVISDVPQSSRDEYVGINNVVAGQTAGRVIVLAHGGRSGRVLPIVGALSARDHAERLDGLHKTLATSSLEVANLLEGRDQHHVVEQKLRAVLAADPGITAIYSAGAGNAGLIRVIEQLPTGRPRPIVVLHELVPRSREALEKGLIDIVIDQRPEEEVARTIASLRRIVDRRPSVEARQIVPAIYVKENLPAIGAPVPLGEPTI